VVSTWIQKPISVKSFLWPNAKCINKRSYFAMNRLQNAKRKPMLIMLRVTTIITTHQPVWPAQTFALGN
jgi:hypothetical protein